jgi:thiamine biosynthesis lipoprotein
VGVAHPERRDRVAMTLALAGLSAATSGQSERSIDAAGERIGHVLDPRSGHPVPAWGSVTVVATDPLVADILSTALLVMGPEAGRRWVAAHPEVHVLFLVVAAGGLERWCNESLVPLIVPRPTNSEQGDRTCSI